jgi:hypothetical protein
MPLIQVDPDDEEGTVFEIVTPATYRILEPDQEVSPPTLATGHICCFDMETKPTSFRDKFPLAVPIAIAASWGEGFPVECWVGNDTRKGLVKGLRWFVKNYYEPAYMVSGHNIRDFDLPLINGALLRCGLPPLGPKLVRDTLRNLIHTKAIGRSLENLAVYLGLDAQKMHLAEASWEEAWGFKMDSVVRKLVEDRCSSDVEITLALEAVLLKRGLLNPPRIWRPR